VIDEAHLQALDEPKLRVLARSLIGEVQRRDREIAFKQAAIDKLTHEMAVLKRLKFAAKSEAFNGEQKSLIEETLDTDLAALAAEIEVLHPKRPAGPSARRCRRICRAASSATSRRTPPVAAARR
jgi:transposase